MFFLAVHQFEDAENEFFKMDRISYNKSVGQLQLSSASAPGMAGY